MYTHVLLIQSRAETSLHTEYNEAVRSRRYKWLEEAITRIGGNIQLQYV